MRCPTRRPSRTSRLTAISAGRSISPAVIPRDAHFAFGDGAARFLSESINADVSKLSERQPPGMTPSSDGGILPLRTVVLGTAVLAAVALLAGFFWPRTDYRARFDVQVEERWIDGRELMCASEFFGTGGVYENSSSANSIDQKHLVPLIERLQQDHQLEFEVIVEPDQPKLACGSSPRFRRTGILGTPFGRRFSKRGKGCPDFCINTGDITGFPRLLRRRGTLRRLNGPAS